MRLLNTRNFEIREFRDDEIPQYAILSHTWGEEEVTFQDMQGTPTGKRYDKVKNFCFVSMIAGFEYVWIDTCCIDKTSSVELSEAINSMYRWYQMAEVCYAYLADVSSDILDRQPGPEFSASKWFTRGWTLQELIAPSEVIFLRQDWRRIGTRSDLQEAIFEITGIPVRILSGEQDLEVASIAQRMSWAANRKTSRLEDKAYCLMGMFGINMPLLYGEGETAFVRLQEEIMKVTDDYSIFAWESKDQNHGGLLATSPDAFKESANIIPRRHTSIFTNSPLTITSKGIHLELPFMGIGHRGLGLAILHCTELGFEDMLIAIYVRDISLTMERFDRVWSEKLELIDLACFRPSQYPPRRICIQRRLAVARTLNIHGKHGRKFGAEEYASTRNACQSFDWELFEDTSTIVADDIKRPVARVDGGINSADRRGRTPLSHAAELGHVEEVRSLLSQKSIQADSKDEHERTPLSYAAGGGHTKVLWLLLARHKVKADSKDKNGRTPLSYAAGAGHDEVVWLLLTRSDVEPYSRDYNEQTPLSHAAKKGHEAVIRMFLAREDVRNQLKDGNGRSPLSYASESGQVATVKMLLTRSDIEPDIVDKYGLTPLWWAVKNGHLGVVKLLVESGADTESKNKNGLTPLSWAAQNGKEAIVKLLFEIGANTESKDKDGLTPLWWAVINKHEAILKLLLEKDAEKEIKNRDSQTPLWWAVMNKHEAVMKLLLENGAKTELKNRFGGTLLSCAAGEGHEAIVKLLLENGAKTESKDKDDQTPLWWAMRTGKEAVVKQLLENGADTESKDRNGQTPLSWAAQNGKDAVVRLLLENNADTESKDEYSRTPLFWAAVNGHEGVVKQLLENGAKVELKDKNGQTPLSCAGGKGQEAVVRLLLESGAEKQSKDKDGQTPRRVPWHLRWLNH
ncbi:hypothetical protein DL763_010134 [Monosporascus cannonballus]|nr:hypothetical protein DL763_010134 [Monosporascus cannonballus]